MNSSKRQAGRRFGRHGGFSIWSLAMTVGLGVCGVAAVHAQETTGKIFGWAPAGQTVTVHSTTGVHRHAKANAKGRYNIGALPMGVYEVTLDKDGKLADKRSNIKLTVGRGAEVDFACDHDQCAGPTG